MKESSDVVSSRYFELNVFAWQTSHESSFDKADD